MNLRSCQTMIVVDNGSNETARHGPVSAYPVGSFDRIYHPSWPLCLQSGAGGRCGHGVGHKRVHASSSGADLPEPNLSKCGESAVLAVDGQGMRLFDPKTKARGADRFWTVKIDVLALLVRLRGSADSRPTEDCDGLDYANWPDGLNLVFEKDHFAGWGLDRRAADVFASARASGPGSTRDQLHTVHPDVHVENSTLGVEFQTAGFAGVLDRPKKSAKITDMWAGTVCIAR